MTYPDDGAKSAVLVAGIGPGGQTDALMTDGAGALQSTSIQSPFTSTQVVIEQAVPGTLTLAAATGGKTSRIAGAVIVLDTDGTLTFKSNGVAISGAIPIAAKSGFVIPPTLTALFRGSLGNDLQITTTGGGAHGSAIVITE